MLVDILRQLNWVDIFVLTLLFRMVYIAMKSELSMEAFKFIGTVAAIYLSLHYYTTISDFLRQRFATEKMPLEFLDFVLCLFLAILSYAFFVLWRIVLQRFIKMEAATNLNRVGGLVVGLARGVLVTGLIMFMLVISSFGYLKNSVNASYLGKRFFGIAPATYSWLWNSIASRFMSREKFNQTVTEVQEGFFKK